MLESNAMLHRLLTIITRTDQLATKNLALDIVFWVFVLRMARFRSPKSSKPKSILAETVSDLPQQQRDCAKLLQTHMLELMRSCYLRGNRTAASKCTKIILVTSE